MGEQTDLWMIRASALISSYMGLCVTQSMSGVLEGGLLDSDCVCVFTLLLRATRLLLLFVLIQGSSM